MKRNYSKELRKFIQNLSSNTKKILINIKNISCLDSDEISYISIINSIKVVESIFEYSNTDYKLRITKIKNTFIILQLYTDLYKKLKYKEKFSKLDIEDISLLAEISQLSTYDQIINIFDDKYVINNSFNATLTFNSLPVYEKILQIKSLSEEDCKKLGELNPIFNNEKQNYDININTDFIIRQIGLWQKKFNDNLEKSYDGTVDFIFNLYKVRKEEAVKLVDLILKDLNIDIKGFNNINPSSETIEFQNYKLTKDELKSILKDYYNIYGNSKVNGYKKDN